jgi:FHA domain-containing protein
MIKITAVSYNNQATPAPLSAVFGRDGGTLGRSEDNFFILQDPKNLVSRIQASIKSDGARHTITNLSQANPILLNGKEIEFNREYPLNAGDEIQVGLYILKAEPHLVAVDTGAAPTVEKPVTVAPQPIDIHAVPPSLTADTQPRPAPTRIIPNLAELHQKKNEASGLRARHTEEPESHSKDKESKTEAPAEHAPESVELDALMQAFLKGAGIPQVSLNSGMTPEFMEMLGKLLATSIKGTFQLLATRSSIKKEVRADVTMVVVRNNNPLKFLSDSETVLVQMLRKKMPGFMGPSEAMEDALADLHAHQTGMVAGMNGAITEVLKRFDPKTLEARAKSQKVLDTLVPLHKKARMWDQYDAMFEEVNREAHKDYHKLFGRAFLKAYEKEIARSRGEDKDG